MKCPEGFCRDAEHCMQGGRCEDAVGDLTPLTLESAELMAPGEWGRINRCVAAELLAWAQECERRINGADDVTPYKTSRLAHIQLAGDLRGRAFALSPPSLDDVAEIEARLAELRAVRR